MSDTGKIVRNVVEYIISQIVEDEKSVKVDISSSDDENVAIEVRTAPSDMGRVIGKRGRVARAIRTVAQAAADEEVFNQLLNLLTENSSYLIGKLGKPHGLQGYQYINIDKYFRDINMNDVSVVVDNHSFQIEDFKSHLKIEI